MRYLEFVYQPKLRDVADVYREERDPIFVIDIQPKLRDVEVKELDYKRYLDLTLI